MGVAVVVRRCGVRLAVAGLAIALLAGCRPTVGGGTTRRITAGTASSWSPSVSADGRFVAYTSQVSGDPGGWRYTEVFLWNRRSGRTTQLTQGDNGSHKPSVSGRGEVVAFESYAEDLVPGDTNNTMDVFVWERATGGLRQVPGGDRGSMGPRVSDDGRYVMFGSYSALVPEDTDEEADAYVWDRTTGVSELVPPGACLGAGDTVSHDGRYVTYSTALGWSGEGPSRGDVFVCDRVAGTTTRVTAGDAGSFLPVISGDGRYVAFTSRASNLVAGDTNGIADVFVWSRSTGAITRISDLQPFDAEVYYPPEPVISDDGGVVAYATFEDQAAWSSGRRDVFRWNRAAGTTSKITDGNGSGIPAMSGDGRLIAYVSGPSDLVPGDTDENSDIFLWTRVPRR
jgi:Tol biopolymer transport system component